MGKVVCSRCKEVHDHLQDGRCPRCGASPPSVYEFGNSDEYLGKKIPRVLEERERVGLTRLVGGLECVIINTEPNRQQATVKELLRYKNPEV